MKRRAKMEHGMQTICRGCVLFAIAAYTLIAAAAGVEVQLGEHTVVRFADQHEGIAALTKRDDYIQQLSPFDRQVRLRTDRPVSEEEFLGFTAGHVRPWTNDEIARISPLLDDLAKKLRPWKLPLPPEILLVKTSGEEEGRAAYCRGNAIVLPQNMVDQQPSRLPRILPHEVFHVLSSHNPELRQKLYSTIGFYPTGDVRLPDALNARKITNPDAPLNNYAIATDSSSGRLEWLPILVSKSERYDAARGGTLFDYLEFRLMQLERDGNAWRPALRNGQPILVDPASVPGYAAQIGDNTKYIIHPEEILADNFVFLLDGRIDLPTPRIVEAMGNVLQETQ
jgi:hypothetical protein